MTEAIATIGHNQPPEPTPYEKARDKINDLYDEAKLWLDGAVVDSQALADGIGKLIKSLRDAVAEADAARIIENEPFDRGKAEVQARYAPLIADTKTQKGKAALAINACKNALAPWLDAIDRAQREAAEKLRQEAAEKTRLAQEAIRKVDAANLAEREAAEALVQDAKKADALANKVERSTATAATGGRAIGLRTTYQPELTDATAAARHYWQVERKAMEEFLIGLAERDCRAGRREIPGFTVHEKKTAA